MRRSAIMMLALLVAAGPAFADVKTEERSQLKFEGALGRMLNLFGGSKTRDGQVSTVALKGARKMTVTGDTGQIIDLDEEKIYDIDIKDKSYRVTTFAALIKQMQDARRKAAEDAAKQTDAKPSEPAPTQEPQYEIDFDLKESGQRKAVNGFDAREVVMTVTVREKGKTLEQSGGFVTTSNIWLAPRVPGTEEMAAFDLKYAQKLLGPALIDPQQIAAATAMYPMMGAAMERMQKEKVNMDGTAVQTIMRFEAVASAEAAKAEASQKKEEPAPTGLGGLGGRLARRVLDRNKDADANTTAAPSQPGRATVMTFTQDLLKATPAVAAADVAIPANFKEKR